MKVLYYECFSGISGDMNLGALVDIGVDLDYLISELNKLSMKDEFEIKRRKSEKKGIVGTKIDVILKNQPKVSHSHGQITNQTHDHEGHHHSHEGSHSHGHGETHKHEGNNDHNHDHSRNIKAIYEIINESELNNSVKRMSKQIFDEVAIAEAKVHGKTLEEVHFHEVGATDSIVDIIGAAICIDYLKVKLGVEKIIASPVELGGGFVKCAHGLIPVPAPATIEILKGVPTKLGRVNFETTTPTGAAILKALVCEFVSSPELTVEKIGYGMGTKDFEIPNAVRVMIGNYNFANKKKNNDSQEKSFMIETNIDDMNPEYYEFIEERLFEHGASDVFKTQIMMKKGRPAIKLNVLVKESKLDIIIEELFTETTTLGMRKYQVEKLALDREFVKIDTKFGQVTIKKGMYNGTEIKAKPEYEDCRMIADMYGITLLEVYREIDKCYYGNEE